MYLVKKNLHYIIMPIIITNIIIYLFWAKKKRIISYFTTSVYSIEAALVKSISVPAFTVLDSPAGIVSPA